jgi:hypothetical protein
MIGNCKLNFHTYDRILLLAQTPLTDISSVFVCVCLSVCLSLFLFRSRTPSLTHIHVKDRTNRFKSKEKPIRYVTNLANYLAMYHQLFFSLSFFSFLLLCLSFFLSLSVLSLLWITSLVSSVCVRLSGEKPKEKEKKIVLHAISVAHDDPRHISTTPTHPQTPPPPSLTHSHTHKIGTTGTRLNMC